MLPFFEQPAFKLGPVTIHVFGIVIALSIYVGLTLATRRFQQSGLDVGIGERMTGWILVGALLGAHLFSVVLYFPDKVVDDPWLLLRFWEDISSFGGMLGGLLAAVLYLSVRLKGEAASERWAYLDVIAFVFPFGLAVGRVGCALAHDHPGTVTHFPLTFSLQSPDAQDFISNVYTSAGLQSHLPSDAVLATMGFHDLGWYELLYLSGVVLPMLTVLNRKARVPGFNLLLFGVLYLPVRFAFDFLRVSDARYAGLTPGQWTALVAAGALPFLWVSMRSRAGTTMTDASSLTAA